VLDQLIDAVRGGAGRTLVVRGEPGVGKTALLDYLAEHASGCRVAHAAGVESEMELAFAGLHQLCAPMLDRLERLPGPQREALRTAFGLGPGSAPDRFRRMWKMGSCSGRTTKANEGTAIYNSSFRPFQSPVPFLFVRHGVTGDWKFLPGRRGVAQLVGASLRRVRSSGACCCGGLVNALAGAGVGHDLPQEAPQAFTEAVVEVDGY
jgi:AAA ATPase domain